MTSSPDPYLLASTILTADELPKLALVTYDASTTTHEHHKHPAPPPPHTQRIFVIVSNVSLGVEQSCILVIKPRRKDAHTAVLLSAIPILPDLKIEIEPQQGLTASAATPRIHVPAATTLGLSSLPQSLPTMHALLESVVPDLFDGRHRVDSSNAALKLTLSHGAQSAVGVTSDARGLKDFLSVLKSLLEVAQQHAFASGTSYAWMQAYVDDLHHPPQHAHKLDTPIFSRFSNSAFLPSTSSSQEHLRPASPTAADIRICVGTFNVNGRTPPDDIATLLGLKRWIRAEHDPDVLVLGFQEVDTSGGAYLYHSPAREDAWTRAVTQALGRRADSYAKMASKQLVGLMVLVWARTELGVEEVATASVGVGLGGFVANKGAVAVRMRVGERTVCFVNSHLSAFEGLQAMERRCWDWSEIYKRLRFRLEQRGMEDLWETPGGKKEEETLGAKEVKTADDVKEDPQPSAEDANGSKHDADSVNGTNDEAHQPIVLSAPTQITDELTEPPNWHPTSTPSPPSPLYTEHPIMAHDLVIHFGDLNFRLDLSHSEAHRLIRERDFSTLYKYDELESLRTSGSLFDDFDEGTIRFAPTYKFDSGTDRYDTSEKHRVPAWCDRVLWAVTREWGEEGEEGSATREMGKGEEGSKARRQGVVLQAYESVPDLKFSDHRPVRATLLVRVR
ncbi:related to INP52-phosphatidylinositol phosphate phosphatase [Sporisorium reilianum f. sp. reilianum]|uniref:Related to INP52-phosphatidylinositol phosphate phosphatase n=1 Tax=Sporisorium reilianum f. sp. reilianum TaxID=72559 RepID=A0A2N8UBG7_9BASI|nr:related to INP52-phosphatidylinositol phosphate phosphatase [Sporisorium reilianum f. sp. reilianum]